MAHKSFRFCYTFRTMMKRIDNRWIALGLLWVAYFLLQGTRQIYGATLPQIRADFGVDDLRMGMVASVFFFAYAAIVPLGGFAADLFRRKWVIVLGSALFVSGVFLASFASSVGLLILTYGVLNGVGQSLVPTSSTSVIQQLHADSRATALSVYQLAAYAGIILCSVSSGYLGSLGPGGWRSAFRVFGGFGILWVAVLVVFLREPPAVAAAARPKVARALKEGFLALATKPSAILMTLAFGLSNFGDIGFRTWMPTFLQEGLSLAPARAAFHAVIWFYVGGFLGILAGSRLSDAGKRRGRIGARLDCNLVGLVLCAPLVCLVVRLSGSLAATASALAAYGFVHGFYDANFIASFYEVIVPRYRTSAYGLYASGAFALGACAPVVLGALRQSFPMTTAFATLGGFYLAAAALTLVARTVFLKRDYEYEREETR